jgi:hypothetical protein
MSPILFDLSSRSASLPRFSFWDREHFRLIPAYLAAGLLSTQIRNEVSAAAMSTFLDHYSDARRSAFTARFPN